MSVPLVLEEGRACGLDVMRNLDGGYAPETDRRRRVRVALALPVSLFRGRDSEPVEGRTKNVSSEGFYCVLSEPLAIGESVRSLLMLPAFTPLNRDQTISIECCARVVRVEPLEDHTYGIACHIEAYRVLLPHAAEAVHNA